MLFFTSATRRAVALVACLCLLAGPLMPTAEARVGQALCSKALNAQLKGCKLAFENTVLAACGAALLACGCGLVPSPIEPLCLLGCGLTTVLCIGTYFLALATYDNCVDQAYINYDMCIDDIEIDCV